MKKVESQRIISLDGRQRVEDTWECGEERCHTSEVHTHEFILDDEETIRTKVDGFKDVKLPS